VGRTFVKKAGIIRVDWAGAETPENRGEKKSGDGPTDRPTDRPTDPLTEDATKNSTFFLFSDFKSMFQMFALFLHCSLS